MREVKRYAAYDIQERCTKKTDDRLALIESTIDGMRPGAGAYVKTGEVGIRLGDDLSIGYDITNRFSYAWSKIKNAYQSKFYDQTHKYYNLTSERWLSDNFEFVETPLAYVSGTICTMYLPIRAKKDFASGTVISTVSDMFKPYGISKFECYNQPYPEWSLRFSGSSVELKAVGKITKSSIVYLYNTYILRNPTLCR